MIAVSLASRLDWGFLSSTPTILSWLAAAFCKLFACSCIFSIFNLTNSPNLCAKFKASPGFNVCTCTLTISSSCTTTILFPGILSNSFFNWFSENLSINEGSRRTINSVQYPYPSSPDSNSVPALTWPSDLISTKSTRSPVKAAINPVKTSNKPAPPLSTTPTSFNTGSNSGVLSNEFSASLTKYENTSSISIPGWVYSTIFSLASLITVKIVPSTGLMTAL